MGGNISCLKAEGERPDQAAMPVNRASVLKRVQSALVSMEGCEDHPALRPIRQMLLSLSADAKGGVPAEVLAATSNAIFFAAVAALNAEGVSRGAKIAMREAAATIRQMLESDLGMEPEVWLDNEVAEADVSAAARHAEATPAQEAHQSAGPVTSDELEEALEKLNGLPLALDHNAGLGQTISEISRMASTHVQPGAVDMTPLARLDVRNALRSFAEQANRFEQWNRTAPDEQKQAAQMRAVALSFVRRLGGSDEPAGYEVLRNTGDLLFKLGWRCVTYRQAHPGLNPKNLVEAREHLAILAETPGVNRSPQAAIFREHLSRICSALEATAAPDLRNLHVAPEDIAEMRALWQS